MFGMTFMTRENTSWHKEFLALLDMDQKHLLTCLALATTF
jgi:hypothetical protein